MGPARVAQMVEEVRGICGGGAALLRLAVQDPQRVLEVPRPVGRAQLVGPLGEEGAQERDVARAAHPVAHGIQPQGHPAQAEAGEEVVRQRHDLDVEVGVGRPECLHAQLVVLAVTAVLGILVPERRRHVPGLPGRHRVVLHVRPGNGGRSFRAERHHLAVPVLEDVHLLADHLAALADAAQEHAGVLEDRRDGQPVAGTLDQRGEAGHRCLPARRFGPEHVVHALRAARRRCRSGPGFGRGRARAHKRLLTARGVRLSCQGADDTRRRPRQDASRR